ncbi:uncharacterized protein LOC111378868 isoform X1 [Olea europaea var. sylvestris]|uniref:uncharacterized protein LOC111378868 isoform X1 n=1 Tax=Olea europaea var. sylvestris TaxID=158386 RepID=UPI000C1CCE42|nr:uncharacterized protein LOC111378868 isoform X1 [Olea europaea var. sylvestris]
MRLLQVSHPHMSRGHSRERNKKKMLISNGIEDEDKWPAEGIPGIQHIAFYLHRALVARSRKFINLEVKHSLHHWPGLIFKAQLMSKIAKKKIKEADRVVSLTT